MLDRWVDENGVEHYKFIKGKGKKSGKKGHNVPHSKETKSKMSESAKRLWKDNNYLINQCNARREQGLYIRITNGTENRWLLCELPIPEGFWRGISHKKSPEEIRMIYKIANHWKGRKKKGVKK